MNAVSLHPDSTRAAIAASPRDKAGATGFADFIRLSLEQHGDASSSKLEQARFAANQLVSVAFIKPMLAQVSQSPFKTDLFHGGQGEAMFQGQLDTVIADRVAGRMNVSIADAIYRRITRAGSLNASSTDTGQSPRLDHHG